MIGVSTPMRDIKRAGLLGVLLAGLLFALPYGARAQVVAFDGSVANHQASSVTSVSTTFFTSVPYDVVFLVGYASGISSCVSNAYTATGGGLAFTRRAIIAASGLGNKCLVEFTAPAAALVASSTFTFGWGATVAAGDIAVFALSGTNYTAARDPNGSLPAASGASVWPTFSTTGPRTRMFLFSSATGVTVTGWTTVQNAANEISIFYHDYSTAQTNVTPPGSITGVAIADGVRPGSAFGGTFFAPGVP